MGRVINLAAPPIVGDGVRQRDARARLIMFLIWLALVGWLMSGHVFWRDEVRALSLALSDSNVVEMLRNVQGEGHPAIWYLLLRGAHEVAPYREVLPAVAALIGIVAMVVLAFRSPFSTLIVGLVLFSKYSAYEYVVIARNYGLAALIMFLIAAFYSRVSGKLWFGLLLALLCNTNVASAILAAAFLLFRMVEMLGRRSAMSGRDWKIFCGNAAIAAFGALLCFITVYPTAQDAAVSENFGTLTASKLLAALWDSEEGFWHLGVPHPLLLLICCAGLARWPAALVSAVASFLALKMFFYFVYPSHYRHEVLFVIFLLSLYWIVAEGAGGRQIQKASAKHLALVGQWAFVCLLVAHSLLLLRPIYNQVSDKPRSRSAELAALLQQPELRTAIVMGDPDVILEPLPYYVDNPLWLLRQQKFGQVVQLSLNGRRELTLDQILADARRLHQASGRPVVMLFRMRLRILPKRRQLVLFKNATIITPESERRFRSSTRLLASYPLAATDESYDVFVYPR